MLAPKTSSPCHSKFEFEYSILFANFEERAASKGLCRPLWLSLMTATTIAVDSERSMTALYNHVTYSMKEEGCILIAEFMREIGLRGIAVIGVSRVINILVAFYESLHPKVKSALNTRCSYSSVTDDVSTIGKKGQSLWNRIHYPMEKEMERKLATAHPDLAHFNILHVYVNILHVYGGLLMRSGSSTSRTVGRITMSLSAIACLRADQGRSLQLLAHVLSLKKACSDGSWKLEPNIGSEEEIKWLASDEGCIWLLGFVDDLKMTIINGEGGNSRRTVAKL
ncbi:uncharacterized protein SETTUDRAFT_95518 [Exserohilum turcica Et28A]|uniref:Uncharacterized protein n=1 Tax=Exserohilum turcicum (strain 28A) TaxID=671987 RepID=R0IBT7_EXST2|nr:uncharacterized protein SETTUDRAFT_95518 [Exserohilum turcica Et28A]EOA82676.1 hypothetical protein SETTUDRAFT_95518 [Exserohilum turcica Et28A]